jgi:hypothetical protein
VPKVVKLDLEISGHLTKIEVRLDVLPECLVGHISAQATSGVSVSSCSPLTHKDVAGGEYCNVRARLDQLFAVRWYAPPVKTTRHGESKLGALYTLELL